MREVKEVKEVKEVPGTETVPGTRSSHQAPDGVPGVRQIT
jgi:hypothetical protein